MGTLDNIFAFHKNRHGKRFYGIATPAIICDYLFTGKPEGEEDLDGELIDCSGNGVGATLRDYNNNVGVYDFDGDYDTWTFKREEDLDEDDLELIKKDEPGIYRIYFGEDEDEDENED
jgi:hypothetical protein